MIHLDTHAVVWLYAGQIERFPPRALRHLETHRPMVSPMVRLELALLHEIGRVTVPPATVLDELRRVADLGVAESTFPSVSARAGELSFTRDPFDRIIAAHALCDDVPLLTRDRRLLQHCAVATWS